MNHPLPHIVTRSLQIARAQLGVHEAGTTNTGPQVDQYLSAVHLPPGQPWCAAFWYWCIRHAALELHETVPVICSGSCRQIATWGEAHGLLDSTPQVGDAFLRWATVDGIYRAAHIGHVVEVDGQHFHTIEGNSNTSGEREGTSVVSLKRPLSNRYKFLAWGNIISPN